MPIIVFGINLNSVLPLRAQACEQSEMLTQILFGEHFAILQEEEKFFLVRNFRDGYEGWASKRMVTPVSREFAKQLAKTDSAIINRPTTQCFIESRNENITLTGGSILPFYDPEKGIIELCDKQFYIAPEHVNLPLKKKISDNEILSVAFMYLNTPYLWGGKNALGIDCSGFVQVVFSICGRQLPRDASQQVDEGSPVNFLSEARSGDLAFFDNDEGDIIHVGILVNNSQIIHASGRVKIEDIDTQGIISENGSGYSHRLRVIKRVL
jgi:hypothetical protein